MKNRKPRLAACLAYSCLLVTGLSAAANPPDQTGLSKDLKACYEGCTSKGGDNNAYESCMLNCKKVEKQRKASMTPTPKR
jgi:hypothetical protein